MKLKALILAAGLGSRFGASTQYTNKCLHTVGNTPLLIDIIHKLISCNITDIYIVVGYQAEKVKATIKQYAELERRVTLLDNPHYSNTTILDSFLIAEPMLRGKSFIFTTGDHYFKQDVLNKCIQPTNGIRYLKQVKQAYNKEDSKIGVTTSGHLWFGKHIPIKETIAEFGGMAQFSCAASIAFFDAARKHVTTPKKKQYVMSVFNDIIAKNNTIFDEALVDEDSRTEIDHVRDLLHARTLHGVHSQ